MLWLGIVLFLSASAAAVPVVASTLIAVRAPDTTCYKRTLVDCIYNYEELPNVPLAQCPPIPVLPASCAPPAPTTTAYSGPLAEAPAASPTHAFTFPDLNSTAAPTQTITLPSGPVPTSTSTPSAENEDGNGDKEEEEEEEEVEAEDGDGKSGEVKGGEERPGTSQTLILRTLAAKRLGGQVRSKSFEAFRKR